MPSVDYVARLENKTQNSQTVFYALDDVLKQGFVNPQNHHITPTHLNTDNPNISPWLQSSLAYEFERLQAYYPQDNDTLAIRFGRIAINQYADTTAWFFDERFGLWAKQTT